MSSAHNMAWFTPRHTLHYCVVGSDGGVVGSDGVVWCGGW